MEKYLAYRSTEAVTVNEHALIIGALIGTGLSQGASDVRLDRAATMVAGGRCPPFIDRCPSQTFAFPLPTYNP